MYKRYMYTCNAVQVYIHIHTYTHTRTHTCIHGLVRAIFTNTLPDVCDTAFANVHVCVCMRVYDECWEIPHARASLRSYDGRTGTGRNPRGNALLMLPVGRKPTNQGSLYTRRLWTRCSTGPKGHHVVVHAASPMRTPGMDVSQPPLLLLCANHCRSAVQRDS